MLALPKPRCYPSRSLGQKIAGRVAVECFKGWQDAQYQRLHAVLAHIGISAYAQWEFLNTDEIDSFGFADKSRRKKIKKWQNSMFSLC